MKTDPSALRPPTADLLQQAQNARAELRHGVSRMLDLLHERCHVPHCDVELLSYATTFTSAVLESLDLADRLAPCPACHVVGRHDMTCPTHGLDSPPARDTLPPPAEPMAGPCEPCNGTGVVRDSDHTPMVCGLCMGVGAVP